MRGLQPSDDRLFVTVCHRHLPAAGREMNHGLSRQTRHQHRPARAAQGRPGDPAIRCQACPYPGAAWPCRSWPTGSAHLSMHLNTHSRSPALREPA